MESSPAYLHAAIIIGAKTKCIVPTDILQLPLQQFKGVGPKVFEKLNAMGLRTIEDMLFHFPLRYQDKPA